MVPQLICVALALRMTDVSRRTFGSGDIMVHLIDAVRGFRRSSKLRKLALAGALDYGVGNAEWNLRPAFIATVWPLWAVGFAPAMGTLGAALSYWYGGRFSHWIGYERSLAGYAFVHRFLGIVSFAVPTVASPALIASTGLGMGINDVSEAALLQREFADDQRATMSSLISVLGSIVFCCRCDSDRNHSRFVGSSESASRGRDGVDRPRLPPHFSVSSQ